MPTVTIRDLGLIDYKEAWDYQEKLFKEVVDRKVRNRNLDVGKKEPIQHYLLFCEHPHVYTLGKSGSKDHLLIDEQGLEDKEASFYKINRGGDITYHGPGQMVVYPIFDMDEFFTDIHKYLRYLEEAVIMTLSEYGIEGDRYEGFTGVWLDPDDPLKARKICAIGVKCARWVTMHGIGFNVNSNLSYFENIVPCGIENKAVTSIANEVGHNVDFEEVKGKLLINLANIFDFSFVKQEI